MPLTVETDPTSSKNKVRGSNPLGSTFSALFELGREKRGANTSENSTRPILRSLM